MSTGAAGVAAQLAVQSGVRRTPPQGAKRGEVAGGTGLPGSPVRRTAPPMVLAPGELHPLAGVPGYEDLVDPEPIAPAMLTEAKELGNVFGHYVRLFERFCCVEIPSEPPSEPPPLTRIVLSSFVRSFNVSIPKRGN